MTTFRVEDLHGKLIVCVNGDSVESSAELYAKKINPRAKALRHTGTTGLAGQFQAYVPVDGGGETTTGRPFVLRAKSEFNHDRS